MRILQKLFGYYDEANGTCRGLSRLYGNYTLGAGACVFSKSFLDATMRPTELAAAYPAWGEHAP